MNREKAETIADRIMTRIEQDGAIHKGALADEIQAGDALDEIVDIISHDGEMRVRRDGTPFVVDAAPKCGFALGTVALDIDDRDTA